MSAADSDILYNGTDFLKDIQEFPRQSGQDFLSEAPQYLQYNPDYRSRTDPLPVQLHKAGIMDLDEFAALPRTTRDVLVSVIVPKNAKGVVYLSQRNQSTDFPVLTCAVANRSGRYVAVIGASPYMAEPVWDEEGILDGLADAKTDGNAALTENSESNAKIDKFAGYVAEHIRFGSNIRAGAEYREMICRVLTRRAVTQSLDICDEIKHEH